MIVVIGQVRPHITAAGVGAGGSASAIALAAVGAGSAVQLVGRVPDDADGDAVLLALAGGGVGHVATLRHPSTGAEPVLQAADVDLALRYLADLGVLVLVDGADQELRAVAADAAAWSGAPLIVIMPADADAPTDLSAGATVLARPHADPDGAFASVVGTFAAALDRGEEPGPAFRASLGASSGWTTAPRD